jgi:hypothetical protein
MLRAGAEEDLEALRHSYSQHAESETYGDAGVALLADRLRDERPGR